MTARGGGPTPKELRNMGPRGAPTYLLGIAKRWHRNLPSLAKEQNPEYQQLCLLTTCRSIELGKKKMQLTPSLSPCMMASCPVSTGYC